MERGGRQGIGAYRAGNKRPRDEDEHPQRTNNDRTGPYRGPPGDRRDERPTRHDSRPYQNSRGGAHARGGRPNGESRQSYPTGPRRGSVSSTDSVHSRQDRAGQRGANNATVKHKSQFDREKINAAMRKPDWELDNELLKEVMGFAAFNTTHDKKVPGNAVNFGVHRTKKSEYRQYMNREGGFNRPLSPSRGNVYAKPADLSNVES